MVFLCVMNFSSFILGLSSSCKVVRFPFINSLLCSWIYDVTIAFHVFVIRGLIPRLVMYMSQGALFFASYEFFKGVFSLEVPHLSTLRIQHKQTEEDDVVSTESLFPSTSPAPPGASPSQPRLHHPYSWLFESIQTHILLVMTSSYKKRRNCSTDQILFALPIHLISIRNCTLLFHTNMKQKYSICLTFNVKKRKGKERKEKREAGYHISDCIIDFSIKLKYNFA